MTWISELHRLYWNMADLWEKDPEGLEATGAGFQITLQALRDRPGKLPPDCGSMPASRTKC
ncbi:MAG: hypothetical protein K2P33_06890 [Acutalibacter sp.]|nr:hypothetical protein [Acutalibacter sp.]